MRLVVVSDRRDNYECAFSMDEASSGVYLLWRESYERASNMNGASNGVYYREVTMNARSAMIAKVIEASNSVYLC
jgi:hypothetical protein